MAQWIRGISLRKVNQIKGAEDVIKSFRESFPELKRRERKNITKLNQNFQLILCNFVYVVFERKNLIIPNKSREFEKGGILETLHLSKNTTRDILNTLLKHDYVIKIKGSKYQKKS